jgi:uncharacterized DUF497 family protein
VPDEIAELLLTETALGKRGARGIAADDARQIPRNAHVVVRNPRGEAPGARRLLIGRTDGGRALTLVVQQTADPTTWVIVTGWESSQRERRLLQQ